MTYNDALNFIVNRQSLGIKPGLYRIRALLEKLSNPQDKIKIIHIAGTNGKGTVAKTIADALQESGLKVGLFSSPWICNYREQIQINGETISESDFASVAESVFVAGADDCTEFELITAMMYVYFHLNKVDYAVIECGMGGKGDATNVEAKNVCSVLTSISIDHTDFLGDTIEKIIAEKEGIIREGSPCFRYESRFDDFNENNLLLAKKVVKYLGFDDNISLSRLPARQQKIGNIIIDGGHNVNAGLALADVINDEVALIGMMRDKDVDGYMSVVAPKCKKIICTRPNNARSMPAMMLANIAKKYCSNVVIIDNPVEAVKAKDITLICGSFYLARDVINLI